MLPQHYTASQPTRLRLDIKLHYEEIGFGNGDWIQMAQNQIVVLTGLNLQVLTTEHFR
jgi:hypothetical protein